MSDADDDMPRTLRDRLAVTRTRLANERTMLAYVRTALMLIVAGATAVKFFGDDRLAVFTGWVLVALGGLVGAIGVRRFWRIRRTLH